LAIAIQPIYCGQRRLYHRAPVTKELGGCVTCFSY